MSWDRREFPGASPVSGELGKTEVEYLYIPVGPAHHVLGLDVAMDEAARVCSRECCADLHCHIDRGIDWRHRAATEALADRLAFDELGHDERSAVEIAEIMNDEDVRMVDR